MKKTKHKMQNPFVQHRAATQTIVHGKSKKALRQQAKIQLKKEQNNA